MAGKVQRQQVIGKLIGSHAVTNQPQLVELLADEGIAATQATVSRDLEDLGAVKVRVPGGETVYAIPEYEPARIAPEDQLRRVLGEWVAEVKVSANLVVLRTPPGCAHVVASAHRSLGHDRADRHGRRRRHVDVRRRRGVRRPRRWPTCSANWPASRERRARCPDRAGVVARAGSRAGPAAELMAFTESLSFDRRLWPDEIAGSIAHVRGLAHSQIISDAEADVDHRRARAGRRRAGRRHVRVRRQRRRHPHRDRAAGHRARRADRRQAAHRSQPQRPIGHQRATVDEARAAGDRRASRRPPGRAARAGTRRRRRLPARVTPTCSGPSRCCWPTTCWLTAGRSAATSNDCSTRWSGSTSRRWAPVRWPARRCRSTLPSPPASSGFAARFENSLDAVGSRDHVAEALFVLTLHRDQPVAHRRGVRAVDERGVRLRPARRRLRHRLVDAAAEEEPRHRRAGPRQGRPDDRQPHRASWRR